MCIVRMNKKSQAVRINHSKEEKNMKIVPKIFQAVFGFCFFFLLVSLAQAGVPKLITYHGILKDSSGNYLSGTYGMTFKLYDVATGGTELWEETHSSVTVASGAFNVILGSVTALNQNFSSAYWLGIEVGSDGEMEPRVQLTSAGYAYTADEVNNGFTESDHADIDHKSIEGVLSNTSLVAKTNFKIDAHTVATANNLDGMIVDTFSDDDGIDAGSSSDYTWRGSPNYDVKVSPGTDVLLLHANGTDASTTFTDSSDGAHAVTALGNAQLDTAQKKFGTASGLFDGSGDGLSIADSADFDFGTGAFTVDMWVRFNSLVGDYRLIGRDTDDKFKLGGHNTAGNIYVYINASFHNLSGVWSPSAGTWYHVACTRDSGGNVRVFVDGVQKGSTFSDSGSCDSTQSMKIAINNNGASGIDAWIDEIRVAKGVAVWTAGFTPPSSEYEGASGDATVVSTAFSESSAPAEAMITVSETLNSGSITYYVSRDNGTNWTQTAKDTVTDISAQPSGTQVRWKAEITGDAELDAIAVAL